ncbi:hypothetical protein DRQ20_05690 [bacterium]|nr:MAG: hypothetical protein DRQ20_05690 [bacterium]
MRKLSPFLILLFGCARELPPEELRVVAKNDKGDLVCNFVLVDSLGRPTRADGEALFYVYLHLKVYTHASIGAAGSEAFPIMQVDTFYYKERRKIRKEDFVRGKLEGKKVLCYPWGKAGEGLYRKAKNYFTSDEMQKKIEQAVQNPYLLGLMLRGFAYGSMICEQKVYVGVNFYTSTGETLKGYTLIHDVKEEI